MPAAPRQEPPRVEQRTAPVVANQSAAPVPDPQRPVNTGVAVPHAALPPAQPGAEPAPVEPAPVGFQQFIAPPPPTPAPLADPGMVVPQAAVPAAPLPGVPAVPVTPASLPMTNGSAQPVAQATPEPVAQPASPQVPVPATAPTPAPRLPAPVAPQIIETAVFMVARDLPATRESAAAANEFLFSEPKLPEAMQRFTAAARGAAVERLPAPLRQAVTRALEALAKATVSPEEDRLPDQLKTAVESLGLDHEARLAAGEPPTTQKPDMSAGAAPAKPLPDGSRQVPAPPLKESLKAAMLEVKRQADLAMPLVTQPAARAELLTLRDTAHDIIQSVQAQQVGGVNAPHANSSLVYVQIPLVLGAELRGGDVQVSWGREKKGKKRDPRVPAQMTMQLETRSLGTVDVSMKMLGNALSLIFRVFDTEVQTFIGKELPGLVDRLTGFKFKVDQAVCEVRAAAPAPAPARTVRATSSLDLKA